MSISTRNTFQSNKFRGPPQSSNYFQSTGPRNFISEELYNIETPQEEQFHFENIDENYEDQRYEPSQEYEEEFPDDSENFPIPASEQQTST